jgi:hypothetical protein
MDRARSALARAIKNVHPLCLCASNRAIRSMVKRLAQAPAPPTPLCQRHRSSIIALRETAHCASGLVPQSVLAQHRSVTCQAIVNPESKAALRQTRIPVAPNRRRALIFQHLRPALTVLPLRALISPILNSATTADSTVKDAWGRLTSHARMRPIATATTQTTQQVSVQTVHCRLEILGHHQVVSRPRSLDQRLTLPLHLLRLPTLTLRRRPLQPQTPVTQLPMTLVALPLQRSAARGLLRRVALVRHRLHLETLMAIRSMRLRTVNHCGRGDFWGSDSAYGVLHFIFRARFLILFWREGLRCESVNWS